MNGYEEKDRADIEIKVLTATIRNSCKYLVWKGRKAFCVDLKEGYGAPTC
mgnify:CR=1 FL=1